MIAPRPAAPPGPFATTPPCRVPKPENRAPPRRAAGRRPWPPRACARGRGRRPRGARAVAARSFFRAPFLAGLSCPCLHFPPAPPHTREHEPGGDASPAAHPNPARPGRAGTPSARGAPPRPAPAPAPPAPAARAGPRTLDGAPRARALVRVPAGAPSGAARARRGAARRLLPPWPPPDPRLPQLASTTPLYAQHPRPPHRLTPPRRGGQPAGPREPAVMCNARSSTVASASGSAPGATAAGARVVRGSGDRGGAPAGGRTGTAHIGRRAARAGHTTRPARPPAGPPAVHTRDPASHTPNSGAGRAAGGDHPLPRGQRGSPGPGAGVKEETAASPHRPTPWCGRGACGACRSLLAPPLPPLNARCPLPIALPMPLPLAAAAPPGRQGAGADGRGCWAPDRGPLNRLTRPPGPRRTPPPHRSSWCSAPSASRAWTCTQRSPGAHGRHGRAARNAQRRAPRAQQQQRRVGPGRPHPSAPSSAMQAARQPLQWHRVPVELQ
jgi:hypothetical protein